MIYDGVVMFYMPLPPLLVTVILMAVLLSRIVVNAETFAQDQPSLNQLIKQGVNATVPSGRERDIYTIAGEGDIYTIAGEVLDNDTVRFSSVRVSSGISNFI